MITIVEKNPNDLISHELNPRTLTEVEHAHLRDSIKRLGFIDPIIVNTHPDRMNIIVGGHMRNLIAKELGFKTVPCVEVNMTPELEREALIRLNRNQAEWNWDDLANNFDVDDLLAWGFDNEELEVSEPAVDTSGDDTALDAGIGKSLTVPGDIYEITTKESKLRLICGDCRTQSIVQALMGSEKAHICTTDPPYNVGFLDGSEPECRRSTTREIQEIANDKMSKEEFRHFLVGVFSSVASVLLNGAAIYVWMSDVEFGRLMDACDECGFHFSSMLVWVKDSLVMGRRDFHARKEPCYYGWKDGGPRLHPVKDRSIDDVIEVPRPKKSDLHSTMKPVELYTFSLNHSSDKGDNCIDFFNGSGTAGIACLKTGRNLFACEIEPKYCDVAVARWVKWMEENNVEYSSTRNGVEFKVESLKIDQA